MSQNLELTSAELLMMLNDVIRSPTTDFADVDFFNSPVTLEELMNESEYVAM